MAAHSSYEIAVDRNAGLNPVHIATFPRLRALAWRNDVLYATRGYTLLRARFETHTTVIEWEHVGTYRPATRRTFTSTSRLASRLFRDGFHALAALSSGHLVGAVPHAIVTQTPGEIEFRETHKLVSGTRPLHLAATPSDHVFWGEYFDNQQRDEVH